MDRKTFRKYLFLIAFGVLLYLGLENIGILYGAFNTIMDIITPILLGLAFAFIANLLVRLFEDRFFRPLIRRFPRFIRFRRFTSLLLSWAIIILILYIMISMITPQLSNSISTLANNIPTYYNKVHQVMTNLPEELAFIEEFWQASSNSISTQVKEWLTQLSTTIPSLISYTASIAGFIINFFVAIILSIYFLANKEMLLRICKKVLYVLFKPKMADSIIGICTEANQTFRSFFGGQFIEACILGSLCFIGMKIFGFPYAPLISVMVGFGQLIPILGAYIAGSVGAFILLMENPAMALAFLIFLVILQQLEGNLIYPHVVGTALGIKGMWVLIAVVVGASIGGILGMFISVPTFALLYSLLGRLINHRLKQKEIPPEKFS